MMGPKPTGRKIEKKSGFSTSNVAPSYSEQNESTNEKKKIKILQTNLNRCRAAMSLIHQTAIEENVDIIAIAEPNIKLANEWIRNETTDVAIKITNGDIKLWDSGSGPGYVWIKTTYLTMYMCYLSPNVTIEEYETSLQRLWFQVNEHRNDGLIIAGDFNAKSGEWGAPKENQRGCILAEWAAANDLSVINNVNSYTFKRGTTESFIDVTFCNAKLREHIGTWKTLDNENLSDHRDIVFDVGIASRARSATCERSGKGWRIKPDQMASFLQKLNEEIQAENVSHVHLIAAVTRAMNDTFTKIGSGRGRKCNYWWNENIAEIRRTCLARRRALTRANRSVSFNQLERREMKVAYKESRHQLKKAIYKAKEKAWQQLCASIDWDTWGDGYKIVCRKMNRLNKISLSEERLMEEVDRLFPRHEIENFGDGLPEMKEDEIPMFTTLEVETAAKSIKKGKAPGPDNFPPEIIRQVASSQTRYVTEVMNDLLKKATFPKEWKRARLVMIEKAKTEMGARTKYRPLSLISVWGKLLEGLVRIRLEEEIERTGGLSDEQYGFRKGRSTVDAMNKVRSLAETVNTGYYKSRGFSVLITLDVENAFGSAPWKGLMEALRARGVALYLRKIIADYLTDRKLILTEDKEMELTCGVPQGSILGPTLWNVYYDGIFRLKMPPEVYLVGYADDLALVINGNTGRAISHKAEQAIDTIHSWMERMGLKMAPGKTEAVILVGRRKLTQMELQVVDTRVVTAAALNYLGIAFDRNMRMREHVQNIGRKASRVADALRRIMPRTGGAKTDRRRVLASVIYSIMLYGAPTWGGILKYAKHTKILEAIHRKMLLGVTCAYRTVSTDALQVIAGIPPLPMMVEERCEIYRRKVERAEIRSGTIEKWQREWDTLELKAQHTKRYIPRISEWLRSRKNITYFTAQMVSGHGCFGEYLHRFKLRNDDKCTYCGIRDSVEHTLMVCKRWTEARRKFEVSTEMKVTSELISKSLRTKNEVWPRLEELVTLIIREKEKEEREVQSHERNSRSTT